MKTDSQKHFENLSQKDKNNLFDIVNSIESADHENAMKVVLATQQPMPEGYIFSHYIIQGVGNQTNTSDVKQTLLEIEKRLKGHRLELTALLKNPSYSFPDDRECIERSILYINNEKGVTFLDGKAISGKIDSKKLFDAIISYKK